MMNLRRRNNHKEILDHFGLTEELAILAQAKDGPTTEAEITGERHALRRNLLSTSTQ
jgi:hypothetical protein